MRYMSCKLLLSALLVLNVHAPALATSLQSTVQDVILTNPDVRIAGSQRDSVEQQMEQARSGFFPQADISIGTGWETSDNPATRAAGYGSRGLNRDEAELHIRQLLFDGYGAQSEFERQRARVNSRAYDTFSTAEVTGLKVVEVYLNVLKEQKLVALASENLANHQSTYDRILKRGESGVGSKADIQQALGRLALARTNLLAEQNRLQDARSAFINVVGHEPGALEETPSFTDLLPANLEEATNIALDNHPRLKSADADIDAAREQLDSARALFSPRIHLEIKASDNANLDGINGSNNDAEIMVRGRYNFTGGKDIARRKETVIELEQAREIRDRTHRQVIESIQLSWNAWQTASQQLEFFKVHVDASKQALASYRKQFNIGQRTLLDLLDQENEVFQASINYINGNNNALFSEYRVLAGIGKLLWTLEVPLPQQASTIQ
jgi:adhesin transport system outer membrane protein